VAALKMRTRQADRRGMDINPADVSRAEQADRERRPIDLDVAQRLREGRLATLKRHRTRGSAPSQGEQRELERVEELLFAHRDRLAAALERHGPLETARALAARRGARVGVPLRSAGGLAPGVAQRLAEEDDE
jgi:hypothetical protein